MVKQDFRLRQMQLTDMGALMEIKNAEHWNQTEQDWKFLIENYPEYCQVAAIEDQVVGTVTSTNFNNQVGWIGMMLVRKPYRGLGISRKLMQTTIDRLSACESIKLDATPAGEKVYEKLGFQVECNVFRITSNLENRLSHDSSNGTINPIEKDALDPLKSMDLQVFGSDRSALVDYLLQQETGNQWCIKEDEQLKGYLLSRFGTNYTQLGPIVAESEDVAKKLIEQGLSRINGPIVIDIPVDKVRLIKWVESQGFQIQREFIRMYLKSNHYAGQPEKCFGIAGPEYG